jgi:hypothetical protein
MISPRHDLVLNPKSDADAISARTQNAKAYMLHSLSISPSNTIAFGAIQNATTEELPTWDAKKICKNICQINQTTTRTKIHELEW